MTQPDIATMSAQSRTALAYAEGLHRKTIADRLKTLLDTGRCTPIEELARLPAVTAVRLSLDHTGLPVSSDVEKWLDSREAVPAGTFWDPEVRTRMSATTVEIPSHTRDYMTDEEAKAEAAKAFNRKTAKA